MIKKLINELKNEKRMRLSVDCGGLAPFLGKLYHSRGINNYWQTVWPDTTLSLHPEKTLLIDFLLYIIQLKNPKIWTKKVVWTFLIISMLPL